MSTSTSSHSARFGAPLPRGLREQADQMTWDDLVAAYGHTSGPVQLGHWACTDGEHAATRLAPCTYQATIAVGDRIDTSTATAGGPLAALTAMLHQCGVKVEMLCFHQLRSGEHTATFIEGSDGRRAHWAIGWSTDRTQSALDAVITCVNRLMTAA